jgi:hypothetical protein
LVLVINKYYLKKELFTSDYIAFLIILLGFVISFQNTISKFFNIPIPEKRQPDEKTDADGKPDEKTDADGKPIEKTDADGKPIVKTDADTKT